MALVFEWDIRKAESNQRKHKVSFDEAKQVVGDPLAITFHDESHSDGEDRFITIGLTGRRRVLLAVHTETLAVNDDVIIRLISARRATPSERKV